ncbi:MAG: cytochrome c oxidase subunit II [Candidatus Omnitrophica bacterium]|nr:cytochrome c oxidase subunit II [Candidatus Omnitrophota bacterium]MDE2223550.1 cytochrome c oxidase subunit II [Candidatus Omnitrophota bacterium]
MNSLLQKLLPMQPLASVEGAQNDTLMYLIHGLILILFIGWAVYFITVLIKFRQRPGHKAREVHAAHKISTSVEWTVAFLELLLLFAFSIPFWAVHQASVPQGKNILEIKVVAQQFAWNVHYAGPDGKFGHASAKFLNDNPLGLDPSDPDGRDDITTMNQIYLPVNKPVIIRLTSKDVIHSFGVPAMRVKQDIIPGMTTSVWFTPDKIGQYEIACSQLCGPGHYRMRGIIHVVSQADYDQWIQQNKGIHD